MCAHMAAWGSDLSLIHRTSDIRTRQIVELAPTNGSVHHRFVFTCPACWRRLPRNSGLHEEEVKRLEIDWSGVDLFFFDRANSAGIYLANAAREAGVMVMFEPPRSQTNTQFNEAVALANIIKYSARDFKYGFPTDVARQAQLQIETQDRRGLRYRQRQGATSGRWQFMPAFDAVQPRDAAGAGDWCSAGFINEMLANMQSWTWAESEIESALAYGQALAAISVGFIGPLGALAALPGEELMLAGQEVLRKGSVPNWVRLQMDEDRAFGPAWPIDQRLTPGLCEACLSEDSTK